MYNCHNDLAFHGDSDIILEYVLKLVNAKSAIDVGCALGTWMYSFKKLGVIDVKGLDYTFEGKTINELFSEENLITHDLNVSPYISDTKYDMALCLEVAEHIDNPDNVIDTLVNLSDVILWSAAIPGQGGEGHVNEQYPSYWQEKFSKYNYVFLDVIRPYIWNNKNIFKWYRQNTFLVVKESMANDIMQKYYNLHITNQMLDVIHPEYRNVR